MPECCQMERTILKHQLLSLLQLDGMRGQYGGQYRQLDQRPSLISYQPIQMNGRLITAVLDTAKSEVG